MFKEISFNIKTDELLVRGIVHPIFYSNSDNSLKREAFLPPPDRRDVSLLRHIYSDDNFCKKHSANLNIKNNQYCGMATFYALHIDHLNEVPGMNVKSEIKASPIDDKGNYITSPPVFVRSSGLPMHADLLYEEPFVKGEVQTRYRKYASKLAKIANYYADPSPNTPNWSGEKLTWKDTNSQNQ